LCHSPEKGVIDHIALLRLHPFSPVKA